MGALASDLFGSKRPEVRGKFLYIAERKLWLRGVTYGPFRPDAAGNEFQDREAVERDFVHIAESGFNALRTYTRPPRWLLDSAGQHGLRVMVGLPWEQHVAFLDERQRARDIEARVRAGVRACAGHPAVLGYAVGNEIPAPIVRWHGRRRVERFIQRLYDAAKTADPEGLVTYVNYPTTEYLQLPFLDFVCFNVYLESQDRLEAYLARLHNLGGDRPVLLAEIGLDSRRHGMDRQAQVLEWQINTAFAAGCAGAFVFAWTDEWFRGGRDIEDWDFGLTTRTRQPKPALAAASAAFAAAPLREEGSWPRISVIVCSYNGARTIRDTCEGLIRLEYPNYEVIVVNDGSTDATPHIAESYGFKVITGENCGLGNARNAGLAAATGDIVAYIDDDAWPEPHWLTYLAVTFMKGPYVGVGGPNIPPPGDGPIAECVANAPGGPVHVLLSDQEAEHIPGCNAAFRKGALEDIGGFDPQFRTAGDDVDVCWRLRERGWTLGFHPAAVVWHHRRNSVRAYWRQQKGYGEAEALLEHKWPEKYNQWGHVTWGGRLYSRALLALSLNHGRIYQGTWGIAPFQSLYERGSTRLSCHTLTPEWYLMIAILLGLSLLGLLWGALLSVLPLLAASLLLPVGQACLSAARPGLRRAGASRGDRVRLYGLTALLHLLQPLARLRGRLRHGLTPWRNKAPGKPILPWPRHFRAWRETWRSPADTLQAIEASLRRRGAVVRRGGDFDSWDLEVHGGALGSARLIMTIEEHGAGRQLLWFRSWPRLSRVTLFTLTTLIALALAAAVGQSSVPSELLAVMAGVVLFRALRECGVPASIIAQTLTEAGASRTRPSG